MRIIQWPTIVGLLLICLCATAQESTLAGFSHDDALAHSQDAIGRQLADIELLDAEGATVTLDRYAGKPVVLSLIFTSCHHICPATTTHLDSVVNKARNALGEDSFHVVTIGFDTNNDTPKRMQDYRRRNGIDDTRWDFLAANRDQLARLVQQLGFIYAPSSRGFDHLIQTSIIDAQGGVYRQVYGITFPVPALIEPLKSLVFGQPEKQSALDYLANRIRLFCTVYDPATDSYQVDVSVFIGTGVGMLVSLLFGRVLWREWRRSLKAGL